MVGFPVIGIPMLEMASFVLPCIGDTMADLGIYGDGVVTHYNHYLTSDGRHYVTSDGMYYKVKD